MKNQKGFSLIELLIVVTIIVVITAIAVPNYMKSRLQANESSAVSSLRSINTAALTYASTYGGFPVTMASMGGVTPCTATWSSACLLEDNLSQGTKSGYAFGWTGDGRVPSVWYTLTATPMHLGTSGQRMFCTDPAGVIRYEPSGAGCNDVSAPVH